MSKDNITVNGGDKIQTQIGLPLLTQFSNLSKFSWLSILSYLTHFSKAKLSSVIKRPIVYVPI